MFLNKKYGCSEASQSCIKLKTLKKPAEDIKNLKVNWNKKLKQHEEAGYHHQEFLNLKKDTQKYELLENLKSQNIPGPFTNPQEIKSYLSKTSESDIEKRDRMRKEVKYARITCSFMKPTASVFRLTRHSKPLETEEYATNLTSF